jgi:hypothetical protein
MSTQRAICPVCEREVNLLSGSGDFRCHGPRRDRCHGSRRTPEQAKRYLVSNLTPRQRELMMECWRVGDWRPIEIEFGIDYAQPRWFACNASPEEELAVMTQSARRWIDTLAKRANATEGRRV